MSQATSTVGETRCAACGSVYRAPTWGRSYVCAACGEGLASAGAARGRSFRIPIWAYYAFAAVMLACVLLRLAAERGAGWRATRAQSIYSDSPTLNQPGHQEERIRTRIQLLEEDHRADPHDPLVLTWLGENYLQLGVLTVPRDKRKGAELLARAKRHAAEIAAMGPGLQTVAETFRAEAADPAVATWGYGGSSTIAARVPALENDPAVGLLGDVDTGSGSGGPAGLMGGEGYSPRPNVMVPGSSFPTSGGSPGGPPGSLFVAPPEGDSPTGGFPPQGRPPGERWRSRPAPNLDERRARLAANPADLSAVLALARALEQTAASVYVASEDARGSENPGNQELRDSMLREALAVYLHAVPEARTRVRKAMLLRLAAKACHARGDTPGECQYLTAAVKQAPYAALVWRQLQPARLAAGDFRGSHEAWRRYREWALPRLRLLQ